MHLAFSAELPTVRVDRPEEFLTAAAIAEFAAAAEDAGFAACHVTDHPAPDGKWLDLGGHHALDPFVALSFAGAATSSLRLLTYVYIAAYRNPFLSAKSALSLDVLSGGRLILGTAAGYLRPEFNALGVDIDERNELLDEALDVMRAAWSGEDVATDGRHFRARGVRMRPVSKPHPPIWMGGNSLRAIRRAVESCEGWAPFDSSGIARATRTAPIDGVQDLAARIEVARGYAEEIGRVEPLDICFSGGTVGDPTVSRADRGAYLRQLAELGVTWVPVSFTGEDRTTMVDRLRRFADEIIAGFNG